MPTDFTDEQLRDAIEAAAQDNTRAGRARRCALENERDARMLAATMLPAARVLEPIRDGQLVATTTAAGGEEVQTTCPVRVVRVVYSPASATPPAWWSAPAEHAGPHDVTPRLLEVADPEAPR